MMGYCKTRGRSGAWHEFFNHLVRHHNTNGDTGMIRNLAKTKHFFLIGAALLLTGLFATGCTTTVMETSGRMPNQNTSRHVQGYQMGDSGAQTVRPVMPLPALRR